MNSTIMVPLANKTQFADLNIHEGKPKDFQRDRLEMLWPRFQDITELNKLEMADQIIYCARELANLSDNDLNQLATDDCERMFKVTIAAIKLFNEAFEEYQSNNQ